MGTGLSAVVVAAGESQRFRALQSKINSKVLIEWGGKPLFFHTLEALLPLGVQEIVLVIREEDQQIFETYLRGWDHPIKVTVAHGGRRRQDSVRLGLQALTLACEKVAIHDGARPFLSRAFMERLIEDSKKYVALIPVARVSETIKEIDAQGQVVRSLDRRFVVRVQTPQIFDYQLILKVHEDLAESSIEFTDDAMMLEYKGLPVQTVEGDLENLKVTTPTDLRLAGIVEAHV